MSGSLSHVPFFETPWTVAHEAPLSIEKKFSRLEWVAIYFSSRSSQPRDQTHISCISFIDRQFLYKLSHWESPFSSGFPTQPLVPMAVSLLVCSVLVNFDCLCPPVLSLQFWQLWLALWPHFPSWLKKSWFFILLRFLLFVRIEWKLLKCLYARPETGSLDTIFVSIFKALSSGILGGLHWAMLWAKPCNQHLASEER